MGVGCINAGPVFLQLPLSVPGSGWPWVCGSCLVRISYRMGTPMCHPTFTFGTAFGIRDRWHGRWCRFRRGWQLPPLPAGVGSVSHSLAAQQSTSILTTWPSFSENDDSDVIGHLLVLHLGLQDASCAYQNREAYSPTAQASHLLHGPCSTDLGQLARQEGCSGSSWWYGLACPDRPPERVKLKIFSPTPSTSHDRRSLAHVCTGITVCSVDVGWV